MKNPGKILDLGSGFSSFVFRYYEKQAEPMPVVWSIDDSPTWLEATRKYLKSKKVSSKRIVTWTEFLKKNEGSFDIISHDMGSMDFRKDTLKQVISLAKPGGYVILDDVHVDYYMEHVQTVLKELNLTNYSLEYYTNDRFGRYAYLVRV